jgi:hypothetical protein
MCIILLSYLHCVYSDSIHQRHLLARSDSSLQRAPPRTQSRTGILAARGNLLIVCLQTVLEQCSPGNEHLQLLLQRLSAHAQHIVCQPAVRPSWLPGAALLLLLLLDCCRDGGRFHGAKRPYLAQEQAGTLKKLRILLPKKFETVCAFDCV